MRILIIITWSCNIHSVQDHEIWGIYLMTAQNITTLLEYLSYIMLHIAYTTCSLHALIKGFLLQQPSCNSTFMLKTTLADNILYLLIMLSARMEVSPYAFILCADKCVTCVWLMLHSFVCMTVICSYSSKHVWDITLITCHWFIDGHVYLSNWYGVDYYLHHELCLQIMDTSY